MNNNNNNQPGVASTPGSLAERKILAAVVATNAAYILADVCDTFLLKATDALKVINKDIRQSEKQEFKRLVEDTERARIRAKIISKRIYKIKDADDAVSDSDFFYDVITEIIQSVGNSDDDKARFLEYIKSYNQACGAL